MSDADALSGSIQRKNDGSFEGCLRRVYEGHDCGALWQKLTEPEHMAQWLAAGTIAPRRGGRAHIDFTDSGIVIDSEVQAYDPPHRLAYSWSSAGEPLRPMVWTLEETDGGAALTLTVGIPAGEDPAKACAGFEGHLEMLAAALEGVPMKFPVDLYLKARAAYAEQLKA